MGKIFKGALLGAVSALGAYYYKNPKELEKHKDLLKENTKNGIEKLTAIINEKTQELEARTQEEKDLAKEKLEELTATAEFEKVEENFVELGAKAEEVKEEVVVEVTEKVEDVKEAAEPVVEEAQEVATPVVEKAQEVHGKGGWSSPVTITFINAFRRYDFKDGIVIQVDFEREGVTQYNRDGKIDYGEKQPRWAAVKLEYNGTQWVVIGATNRER